MLGAETEAQPNPQFVSQCFLDLENVGYLNFFI